MNGTDYLVDSNYIIYFSKGDNEIATFFKVINHKPNKLNEPHKLNKRHKHNKQSKPVTF